MFISGRTTITALRSELSGSRTGGRPDPITDQAAQILLDALDRRETDSVGAVRSRAAIMSAMLDRVSEILGGGTAELDAVRRDVSSAVDPVALQAFERRGEDVLSRMLAEPDVTPDDIARVVRSIAPLEATLVPLILPGGSAPRHALATVDGDTLSEHLRRATGDPGLCVTDLQYLPGGFGKQTYLFKASAATLQGEFVLRTDHASGPLFAKDGHFIANEFDLITQLRDRDYPVAEPIIVGHGADGINDCDMMVTRRSPGEAGGHHLPTDGQAAGQSIEQLATLAARLHALTPPPALDGSGTTLSRDLLEHSREETIRRNISGWRDYWRRSEHSPSLALVALYELLLRIVPPSSLSPRLIHGDFGLHNCMVEDGRLVTIIDWESAHLGEPAEDVALTVRALGLTGDPDRYLQPYYAAGGAAIAPATFAFCDLMAQVRSICICNLSGARFAAGAPEALKLVTAGAAFAPYFLSSIGETVANAMRVNSIDA